jgi:hypothetical protein
MDQKLVQIVSLASSLGLVLNDFVMLWSFRQARSSHSLVVASLAL